MYNTTWVPNKFPRRRKWGRGLRKAQNLEHRQQAWPDPTKKWGEWVLAEDGVWVAWLYVKELFTAVTSLWSYGGNKTNKSDQIYEKILDTYKSNNSFRNSYITLIGTVNNWVYFE